MAARADEQVEALFAGSSVRHRRVPGRTERSVSSVGSRSWVHSAHRPRALSAVSLRPCWWRPPGRAAAPERRAGRQGEWRQQPAALGHRHQAGQRHGDEEAGEAAGQRRLCAVGEVAPERKGGCREARGAPSSRSQKMQRILAEDLPVLSLYVPTRMTFYDEEVFDAWYYTPGCPRRAGPPATSTCTSPARPKVCRNRRTAHDHD